MSNYNIKIDQPEPDKKVMEKHKNFDSLYHQYQLTTKRSFWEKLRSTPKYFASLVAIIAVGYLVVEAIQEEDAIEKAAERAFIHTPFPDAKPNAKTLTADASQPFTYKSPNGLEITIPANAFQTQDGRELTGDIRIHLREFPKPSDIFLAGIPMQYDDTHLDADMMLELLAFQGEEKLQLKSQESIQINIQTSENNPEYAFYFLDQEKEKWVFKGKANDQLIAQVRDEATNLPPRPQAPEKPEILRRKAVMLTRSEMPKRPVKPYAVQIQNAADFPELDEYAKYNKVYFEHAGDDADNPWLKNAFQQEWNNVEANQMGSGYYELVFTRNQGDVEFRTMAKSISRTEYNRQKSEYQANKANYERQLDELTAKEAAQAQYDQEMEAYEKQLKEWEAMANGDEEMTAKQIEQVVRNTQADELGIWCLSRKMPSQMPTTVKAVTLDDKGNEIMMAGSKVYVVDEAYNSLILCENTERVHISFNPASNNQIWMLTAENELWVLSQSEFAKQLNKADEDVLLDLKMTKGKPSQLQP